MSSPLPTAGVSSPRFRIISPLQSGAMREEESRPAPPLDIIGRIPAIRPQSFIQFSNPPDLFSYRSAGKSLSHLIFFTYFVYFVQLGSFNYLNLTEFGFETMGFLELGCREKSWHDTRSRFLRISSCQYQKWTTVCQNGIRIKPSQPLSHIVNKWVD